jgi:hypothetical protein
MSMPAPKELLKYWKWFEANDEEYSHRSLKAKPNAPKEAKEALEKFYKETEEDEKKGIVL